MLGVLFIYALLLILCGSVVAIKAKQLQSSVQTAVSEARSGDAGQAVRQIASSSGDLRLMRMASNNPVWGLMAHAPVIGPTMQGVSTISDVASDLVQAASPLTDQAESLVTAPLLEDGAVDTSRVTQISGALRTMVPAMETAKSQLATVDPSALPGPAGNVAERLTSAVANPSALNSTADLLDITPQLLGESGRKKWFLALQNGSEARGTGGLIGGYVILNADKGRIDVGESDNNSALSQIKISHRGMPRDYRWLWGSDTQYIWGVNMSPHFPYTGQMLSNMWRQYRSEDISGTIAIDEHTLAALLAGTGPVEVQGQQISSDNAVRWVTLDVYRQNPNPAAKDNAVLELVNKTLDKMLAGQFDLAKAIGPLGEAIGQRRLDVWSATPDEQTVLESSAVGGALPDKPGPTAMVVVNNGAGNKLDSFLQVDSEFTIDGCTKGGRPKGHITAKLTNSAPTSGLPAYVDARNDLDGMTRELDAPGSNRALLSVFGPVDSWLDGVTIDGSTGSFSAGWERRHPVWDVEVFLKAGQSSTVDIPVTLSKASAPSQDMRLIAQPMVRPMDTRTEASVVCK